MHKHKMAALVVIAVSTLLLGACASTGTARTDQEPGDETDRMLTQWDYDNLQRQRESFKLERRQQAMDTRMDARTNRVLSQKPQSP